MNCLTARSKLAAYLDDTVLFAERDRVEAHLEACPACSQELQRYKKIALLLSRVPTNPCPDELSIRIRVAAAQSARPPRVEGVLIFIDNLFRPLLPTAWLNRLLGWIPTGIVVPRKPPGELLRNLADFFCSRKSMTFVVDQIIIDMREEYALALEDRRPVKATWVRIRGVWDLLKALLKNGFIASVIRMWRKG